RKGKVLLGTFPAPPVLERVEGYKAYFKESAPDIQVVDVVNDKADPSYAPTAYSQALLAHPDVVGIGGTDGDSGKGAAIALAQLGIVPGRLLAMGALIDVGLDLGHQLLNFQSLDGQVFRQGLGERAVAVSAVKRNLSGGRGKTDEQPAAQHRWHGKPSPDGARS